MPEGTPVRVSVDEASKLVAAGDATVLDVVDTHVYDKVPDQIEGAVRIDPAAVPDEFERLPRERTVLAYCT